MHACGSIAPPHPIAADRPAARRGRAPKAAAAAGQGHGRNPPLLAPRLTASGVARMCAPAEGLGGPAFGHGCDVLAARRPEMRPLGLSKLNASTQGEIGSAAAESEPFDVVILSNGPGEVATWVRPAVRALRAKLGASGSLMRISVLLAPCPHASLREADLIATYPEVDRCQGPDDFWGTLLWGRTSEGWEWRKRGVCLFLGGDQFNALVLGKRLGYPTLVYAESDVRWAKYAEMYLLRTPRLLQSVPEADRGRCTVVGDLFLDAVAGGKDAIRGARGGAGDGGGGGAGGRGGGGPIVALLPGSKPAKLVLGVPYFLACAEKIRESDPSARFVLPVAPTTELDDLSTYADPARNDVIGSQGWGQARLLPYDAVGGERRAAAGAGGAGSSGAASDLGIVPEPVAWLESPTGLLVEVWKGAAPAYELYTRCDLCLTTVGTNTAELAALGAPMVVVLPTHVMDTFRGATGGVMGLLSRAPGWVGSAAASAVNAALLARPGYLSWPNMWAGEEVVPELVGKVDPDQVAQQAAAFLEDPASLDAMRSRLSSLQDGEEGGTGSGDGGAAAGGGAETGRAAERLAEEVVRALAV